MANGSIFPSARVTVRIEIGFLWRCDRAYSSVSVHDDNDLPSHESILDVTQVECWKNDARDLLPQLRFTRRGFVRRCGEDSCELMGDSRAGTVHEPPLVPVEQTRRHLSLQLL